MKKPTDEHLAELQQFKDELEALLGRHKTKLSAVEILGLLEIYKIGILNFNVPHP